MASRKSAAQASQLYQRFLQICEQWPIDSSRQGRDLGSHIKENLETRFRDRQVEVGGHLPLIRWKKIWLMKSEEKEASKMLDSLIKISSNYYRNKYPRVRETAFTQEAQKSGAYNYMLSTEFQNKVKEKEPGFFARLTGKTEKKNS